MKTPPIPSILVCAGAFFASWLPSFSLDVAWDGDGDSSSSGDWDVGANWDGDSTPGSGDNAQLLNVTGGTRTVTVTDGNPQTITMLTMEQTSLGAYNILTLEDDLTISGSSAGSLTVLDLDPLAGSDSLVLNIGDGATLLLENTGTDSSSSLNPFFSGTLNLGENSTYRAQAIGGADSDIHDGVFFSGPVNATGSGAEIQYVASRGWIGGSSPAGNFIDGPISVAGAGASLAIRALQWTGSSLVVSSFNGGLHFRGDDGAGNAVAVGAGGRLDIVGLGSTFVFHENLLLEEETLDDAGGIIYLGDSSSTNRTTTVDFINGFELESGSVLQVVGGSIEANVDGTLLANEGSEILLQFVGSQGNLDFINEGDFVMEGSTLNFDWAATANNSPGGRRGFDNLGTWTLRNGASIAFISSTGRPVDGGFNVGKQNQNSGTFSVESGSNVGFANFFNTGTMNLGSSVAGASEATVFLGSPENTIRTIDLNNGETSAGLAGAGFINILGDTYLGRSVDYNSTTSLNNGTATSTGSQINVGDGTTPLTFSVANRNVYLTNYEGNEIRVRANSNLLLTSTGLAGNFGNIYLRNYGLLVHEGRIQIQSNLWGDRHFITGGEGVYQVQGTDAVLDAMPGNDSGSNVKAIEFIMFGGMSGSSDSDKLTYVNSSGRSSDTYLAIDSRGGSITPGNGSGGAGVSSIGSFELVDVNVTLSVASMLVFDIGGTEESGLYDSLLLSLNTAGSGGLLDLGTDSVLDIQMVNGFLPGMSETYEIVSAEGITGTFGSLLYNGAALDGEYTVSYLADTIEITLNAVPEPSSFAVLLGCVAGGLCLGRRRR
ncbi:MAG: beta strand repeat-containing protein [Puniceicoccales bacterium]